MIVPSCATDEDLYGDCTPVSETTDTETTDTVAKNPTFHATTYHSKAGVALFWRLRLKAHDRCYLSSPVLPSATVTSDNPTTCVVGIDSQESSAVGHVFLWGDGDYEWTPRRHTHSNSASLTLCLGNETISCAPEEFDCEKPFHIRQTEFFYYLSQGLVIQAIPRGYFDKTSWETRAKKNLTLSFTGLTFVVTFTELS